MSLILFSSCISSHFVPHAHNVPLFTEKKQTQINLIHGSSALDFQLARSFTNHFAAMFNYKGQNKAPLCFEVGTGYFTSFNKKIIVEIYGGGGMSRHRYIGDEARTDFGNHSVQYITDIKSYQVFLQPNIGIRISKRAIIGLSVKANYWIYPVYKFGVDNDDYSVSGIGITMRQTTTPVTYVQQPDDIIVNEYRNANSFTLEPALTLKLGGGGTGFLLQAGTYVQMMNEMLYPYDEMHLFLRFGFNWCPQQKTKK